MLSQTPNIKLHQDQQLYQKKQQKFDQISKILLREQGLVRKELPQNPKSLMQALSDCLYFCTNYGQWIQNKCIEELKNIVFDPLIADHPKLSFLKNNFNVVKEYSTSPLIPGFDKISLELASRIFKVKINVYSISSDNYLTCYLINNNYSKEISLTCNYNNHYDSVYSKKFIDLAGISQNIILNLIERAIGISESNFKDYTSDNYINLKTNDINYIIEGQKKNLQISDNQLKQRSLSDNFFPNETILNYPLTTPFANYNQKFSSDKTPQKIISLQNFDLHIGDNQNKKQTIFFSDNLSQAQINQMATTKPHGPIFTPSINSNPNSPIHYVRAYPPGISPIDYPQKSPAVNVAVQQQIIQSLAACSSPYQVRELVKKKTIIIDEGKERYTGVLKFFHEKKNFGFIVMDEDKSDIFLHSDDLKKANICLDFLRSKSKIIRFSFGCMKYLGKYDHSRKATDVLLIDS